MPIGGASISHEQRFKLALLDVSIDKETGQFADADTVQYGLPLRIRIVDGKSAESVDRDDFFSALKRPRKQFSSRRMP